MQLHRSPGLLVAVVAAAVLLPNLGGPPLWDDDEPRNAACSLVMRETGDWIVPTFNGRLRVEKPALVNWLHLAGFALAGVNETGARLGSAVLTIATCLLTWLVARDLFRPAVGTWAGVVMATCLWTGIAGRAATPDAPLAFCTTLALWIFVAASRAPKTDCLGWRNGPVRVPHRAAVGIGAALGLAVLAKGPVGLVLPLLGLGGFCWWQAALDPGRTGSRLARTTTALRDAWSGLRPGTILVVATGVALPWYALVTHRTAGEWLWGFLFVHNVGRFAAPMEGHSGSTLVYYPLAVLVGTFPWSMASALIARHAGQSVRAGEERATAVGTRLLVAWIAAWLIPFSLSGTKLPGYVWPAYPAVAGLTALFIADWIRRPAPATDGWMRWAWAFLAVSGIGLAIGLPIGLARFGASTAWLGLIGIVPFVGAAAAWHCHSLQSRRAAAISWAATACGTVGVLLAAGPTVIGHVGGARQLVARLPDGAAAGSIPMASFGAPASAVFYAGRLAAKGTVTDLADPAEAVAFAAANPGAHFIVDARYAEPFTAALPAGYEILVTAASQPTDRTLLLIGPVRPRRIATDADTPLHR